MKKRLEVPKPKGTSRVLIAGVSLLAMVLVGVWIEQSQQPFPHVRVVKGQPAPQTPRGAGLKAFIDPATGQFREPTADEARELAAQNALAADGAGILIAGDGPGIHLLVPDSAQSSLSAVKNPDGSISFAHTPGAGKATLPTASARKEAANDR
jgi:hypothetical protein